MLQELIFMYCFDDHKDVISKSYPQMWGWGVVDMSGCGKAVPSSVGYSQCCEWCSHIATNPRF